MEDDLIKKYCKDEIDKFLFEEFNLMAGCCSSINSAAYNLGRKIVEKLNERFNLFNNK